MLDYATALTGIHVDVSDALYGELEKHFSDAQILELTHSTLRAADRARLNRGLDAQDDDIPEGAYCLVRDASEGSQESEHGHGS